MRRVLAVFLPFWPIDRRQRRARVISGPWLLVATRAGTQRVEHACMHAVSAGVTRGMTLAHARALLSGHAGHAHGTSIHVEGHDAEADARGLRRLARYARRWSPVVRQDGSDGLLLEVSGMDRLARGRMGGDADVSGERWAAERVLQGLQSEGLTVRGAVASTAGAASAVARYVCFSKGLIVVPPGEERAAIAPLPVEALCRNAGGVCPEGLEALREVGVRNIGTLLALPRAELFARGGSALLRAADEASGRCAERVAGDDGRDGRLEESLPILCEREAAGPVQDPQSIRRAVFALLGDLSRRLDAYDAGVVDLEILFWRSDLRRDRSAGSSVNALRSLPSTRLSIRFSAPAQSADHLSAVAGPRLESLSVGFGIERVQVRARRVQRIPCTDSGWGGRESCSAPGGAGVLFDLLAVRLGTAGQEVAAPGASWDPDEADRVEPRTLQAQPMSGRAARMTRRMACGPRPSRLFSPPIPAVVRCDDGHPVHLAWREGAAEITRAVGPELLAMPWWHERSEPDEPPPVRAYYRMVTGSMRWLWVFCVRGAWYVHGAWD